METLFPGIHLSACLPPLGTLFFSPSSHPFPLKYMYYQGIFMRTASKLIAECGMNIDKRSFSMHLYSFNNRYKLGLANVHLLRPNSFYKCRYPFAVVSLQGIEHVHVQCTHGYTRGLYCSVYMYNAVDCLMKDTCISMMPNVKDTCREYSHVNIVTPSGFKPETCSIKGQSCTLCSMSACTTTCNTCTCICIL